ncbi:cupin domain-containing protein [Paenibacillus validus]|uniref:Cupin domain-containing protein n=1 Tax=Paenibacillus validus TaxID=44253 RepID=A0A7X2Z9V4_9BACL|nr:MULTISPECIES: cupin domain-containing protein [Paenibacillus]MED4600520.1 cupin domain-containing protein [Paenibacillus validus]MED4604779.1 cupin domain-containing protein [Paenibacillus validus]MUG70999.1 cupin domain-containing protein [Paenibacillus validus]
MSGKHFVIETHEVETMLFDWGRIVMTCTPEVTGSAGFSAGIVEMQPGQGHDRHNHPGAEELIYVISGEGEQMVEDASGNPIVYTVASGSTIYVPESRYHYTVNTGKEPMKVFVVYSPPGSEKELRQLPDFRSVPPVQQPKR